jgi:hypothetical protein
MSDRTVSVFHCPTPLYQEMKTISEQEMVSVSAFCRMAVLSLVQDYRNNPPQSEDLSDESTQLR